MRPVQIFEDASVGEDSHSEAVFHLKGRRVGALCVFHFGLGGRQGLHEAFVQSQTAKWIKTKSRRRRDGQMGEALTSCHFLAEEL